MGRYFVGYPSLEREEVFCLVLVLVLVLGLGPAPSQKMQTFLFFLFLCRRRRPTFEIAQYGLNADWLAPLMIVVVATLFIQGGPFSYEAGIQRGPVYPEGPCMITLFARAGHV